MSDKTTNLEGGTGDAWPAMPSFIRQLREVDGASDLSVCFDYWAPTISGYAPLDVDQGRQHCLVALACARQIGSADLLLYIVMAMHGRPMGDIERGFLSELIRPALVGKVPPLIAEATMQTIAIDGGNVEQLRSHERSMAMAIYRCRNNSALFYDYLADLIAGVHGQWIGAAICLLVSAALNGSVN